MTAPAAEPDVVASVHPATAVAGEWGTWVVRVTAGGNGLPPGAGFAVQLPLSWSTTLLNQAKGMHALDPSLPNYVGLRTDDPGARLAWQVEGGTTAATTGVNSRIGLDGRPHRYAYVVNVTVGEGGLRAGATLDVSFGDREGGSPGFAAALNPEGPEPVRITIDETGSGTYVPIADDRLPTLETRAAEPVELQVIIPTDVVVGRPFIARVVALDRYQNRAVLPGDVRARVVAGPASIGDVIVDEPNAGAAIEVLPVDEGVIRLEVVSRTVSGTSNPAVSRGSAAENRIVWGELHSHAIDSFDATGRSPHEYARDVSLLDFYCLTEHSEGWTDDGQTWDRIVATNDAFNDPGRFVTLNAYESTLNAPFGHHNVFFRDRVAPWPLVGRDRGGTLAALWSSLEGIAALTVPHHTGVKWGGRDDVARERSGPVVDWSIRNDHFRRLVEVYSSHGQCVSYDPDHPLAYEQMLDWSASAYSSPGPHYAEDGWLTGQKMGTVAASDNHRGQPGKSHTGLTAVLVPELSREAVYDALAARRTYATTGSRIVISFAVEGEFMGGEIPAPRTARIDLAIVGTAEISWVEVVRADFDLSSIEVGMRWEPGQDAFDASWSDPEPPRNGFYYLRMQQADRVHDRAVMAWSSPVWLRAGVTR